MIQKIYLDMDGVLCDFYKRFIEINAINPDEVLGTFTESAPWTKFVEEGHFATLDWFPGGAELWENIRFLKTLGIQLEILSSSGGHRFYETITEHKTSWLINNGIHIPVNIVPGKRYKKDYAHESHVLIDDTERNVVEFIEAGGKAILHKTFEDTLIQLEKML